ncbi:MAG: RES domain-containing protein, partial [Actinobacteria bacterium]|nr:RES domain-containing protein [Actinomycetota bacterium]
MVGLIHPPARPLRGGGSWCWSDKGEAFFRIYHQDDQWCPNALSLRHFGPLHRFDHHRAPLARPERDSDRSVLYVASSLGTAGAEVFGDEREARICTRYRAAAVVPRSPAVFQSLVGANAMSIGAFPFLGSGYVDRELSQAWASAIYEDLPASNEVCG